MFARDGIEFILYWFWDDIRARERLFKWDTTLSYKNVQEKMKHLIQNRNTKIIKLALLDYSSIVCSRIPKCEKCFATDICNYY